METDRWPGGCFLDGFDEPPPSEVESKVRMIVQKQTETKITLNSQFEQHRDFQDAGELRSLPASSAGLHSAQELQHLHQEAQRLARLVRAGMSDREIALYLQAELTGSRHLKLGPGHSYLCEPNALQKRVQELRERLARRQELEKGQLDPARTAAQCQPPEMLCKLPEDPFTHIAELAKKLDAKRKRRKREKQVDFFWDAARETEAEVVGAARQVDTSLWHAIVPLEEGDILNNRLAEEEIRKLPRFADYEPGKPHSVLYLKNIHAKVSQEELIAIFSRYDTPDVRVKYRVMTGRMRGQAFVYFPDVEAATRALWLANGYQLRGRPIIITFAKHKESATKMST